MNNGPIYQEDGIYDISIQLPYSLDNKREAIRKAVISAQYRIKRAALENDWMIYLNPSFLKEVKVFDTKVTFDTAVIKAFNLASETLLPNTFSAIIADKQLLIVAPELYLQIYPQGAESDYYEKLIAHELAHSFHIRILSGNEEAMGPRWFYEGFAIYIANQFENSQSDIEMSELWQIIKTDQPMPYINYKEIIQFFLEFMTINEMVALAQNNDFIRNLEKKVSNRKIKN